MIMNILENNPEGRRPLGRPNVRWRDQMNKDLRQLKSKKQSSKCRAIWRQSANHSRDEKLHFFMTACLCLFICLSFHFYMGKTECGCGVCHVDSG
ncbi:hypothetical protein J6590_058031 [Homalodisca vitripennis]|nr:hypothetical protein J6590_058031 [Homalodisca vitripennis]